MSWFDRYVWRRTEDRQQLTLEQLLAEDARPVAAGVAVNPATAMQHSAVWACVNLIAGAISTLPLAAYRDGDERPLPALPPILRTPSAGWSLPDFLYAALQSLLVRGNTYGLIVDRAGAGLLPSQVELLAPERVGVTVPNGAVEYRVDGHEVDPASVWHVKAFTAPGQVLGLSPIQHARQAIGLGLGAERFAAKLFAEGIPSGVLTSDQDIKPARAEEIRARGRSSTRASEASPCWAAAPASNPSASPQRKPSSWRPPAPTSPRSPATSASSPS